MRRIFAAAAGWLLACAALAAPFPDPTRPPTMTVSDGETSPGGPRVESILIAPDRRLAVISGEQVTLGSKVAGGSVVRITETEVVVRGLEGDQILRLFPETRRTSAAPTKRGKSP
jgi:MSHA biogenesis protein MshK